MKMAVVDGKILSIRQGIVKPADGARFGED
jgi:hypothetical protein